VARKNNHARTNLVLLDHAKEHEEIWVGLGQATERFILSHSRLPGKKKPQDRERNIGRGSARAVAKGCPLGRALVGRTRITAEHWRLSQHIYRSGTRTRRSYEVLIQYRWDGDIPLEQQYQCLLAGDELTEHP